MAEIRITSATGTVVSIVTDADEVVEVIPDPTPDPEPEPPTGDWPDNEPAGLVPVFPGHPTMPGVLIDGSALKFDYTSQGGANLGRQMFFSDDWDGGPRILLATEPGSKYPGVIRKNFFAGDADGWHGIASSRNFADNYESLYFRMVFRLSDNYQFNSASDKLLYWGEADGRSQRFYLAISSGPNGTKVIDVRNQAAAGGDQGVWRSQTPIHDLPRGLDFRKAWHTIELIVNSQSALGVADGSFRVFLDGVEITDFRWTNPNIPDPGQNAIEWYGANHTTRLFSGVQLPLYWGGSSGVKTVNDHIDVSEVYVTGRKAVA